MRLSPWIVICFGALAGVARAQEFGAWHALGRFDSVFDKGSTSVVLAPERLLKSMLPGANGPDLAQIYDGTAKEKLAWTKLGPDYSANVLDVGKLDLNLLCPPPPSRKDQLDNAVCYLYRRIDAPSEMELRATLGSDDGTRVWLNGALLVDAHVARALAVGDEGVVLKLRAGANHLFVKVTNLGGAYAFQIRPWKKVTQQAINEAIDRGVAFLIQQQLLDGSWGCWENFGGGHAAFTAYTLLKCGVPRDHAAVRMALAVTERREVDSTYGLACLILALEAQGDAATRERLRDSVQRLAEKQSSTGMYDYADSGHGEVPDMSNTLYAALALRAAQQAGLDVPEIVWTKLANGTLRCLEREHDAVDRDGVERRIAGFSYRASEGVFGSVTTGGLSVLTICEEMAGDRLAPALRARIAQAKLLALAWLAQHMTWRDNPGLGVGHHYFWIYGLERVGALLDVDEIGGVDWYWDGATYLVAAQRADGSWNSGNYADFEFLDTHLALLFLKKATARGSGETSKVGVFETTDAAAQVSLRATGDTPLTIWVTGVADALVADCAAADGATLDVEKLEYHARYDGETNFALIESIAGANVRRAELQRFAVRHVFERRGKWWVKAKLFVRAPPADARARTAWP